MRVVKDVGESHTVKAENGVMRIVPIHRQHKAIYMVRLICRDDVNGRESRMDLTLDQAQELVEALLLNPWLNKPRRIGNLPHKEQASA